MVAEKETAVRECNNSKKKELSDQQNKYEEKL